MGLPETKFYTLVICVLPFHGILNLNIYWHLGSFEILPLVFRINMLVSVILAKNYVRLHLVILLGMVIKRSLKFVFVSSIFKKNIICKIIEKHRRRFWRGGDVLDMSPAHELLEGTKHLL